MNEVTHTERVLDAFLAPEHDQLADRVMEAALADIARTPQRRAPRVPWRFPTMSPLFRFAVVAAVLVAALGIGGTILVGASNRPAPSVPAPTPIASALPPGITGWTPYASTVHGFTLGYPEDWSVHAPATREWQAGDTLSEDQWPFADTFISPGEGDKTIGLLAWTAPAGDVGDLDTLTGLRTFAARFCDEVVASSCDEFLDVVDVLCLDAGGQPCRRAILVSTPDAQYAFFGDWPSAMFTDLPDQVTVVAVPRADGFAPAARYGGSVALLKAILTTMDVWPPGHTSAP